MSNKIKMQLEVVITESATGRWLIARAIDDNGITQAFSATTKGRKVLLDTLRAKAESAGYKDHKLIVPK